MRVSTRVVLSIESGTVLERECFEYFGPVAEAISGSGSSNKSKSKSQSTQESGTKYNEDFLNRAREFAAGKGSPIFDSARYLKEHPDVAADPYFGQNPEAHYKYAQSIGDTSFENASNPYYTSGNDPTYNPTYVPGQYTSGSYTPGQFTGANFTSVAPGGFQKLETSLYEGQQSKLAQAYNQAVARQREELAQTGGLNSPSQYLQGSARSGLDQNYIANLQQAARDAFQGRLGAEMTEAGRRTGFDVGEATRRTAFDTGEAGRQTDWLTGEAGRRTAFDTGEAGRQTGFNEQTAARLLDLWLKKLGIAIEAGRYSTGQSTSTGTSSGMSGSGGIFQFGGTSSS